MGLVARRDLEGRGFHLDELRFREPGAEGRHNPRPLEEERTAVADSERQMRAREESLRDREAAFKRRLDAKVEEQVRQARKEIDTVIEGLKTRAATLS